MARFVFVGGLHRSGTSMLARAIGSHPEIAALTGTDVPEDEGQHLQPVYPPATAHGGVGWFAFHPDAHLTERSPLAQPASAAAIEAAWEPFWNDPAASVRVEKSPPNMLKMRFLQALWPDASFVVIVRHPVAVAAASIAMTERYRSAFGRLRSTRAAMRHWERAHRILEADRPHVRRLRVVRYEDVVADPSGAVNELFDWIGVGEHSLDLEIDSGVNDRYLRAWKGSGAWRRLPAAKRFGYTAS